MIANIKKNKRNTKQKTETPCYFSEQIYASRFKIERIFAWFDT